MNPQTIGLPPKPCAVCRKVFFPKSNLTAKCTECRGTIPANLREDQRAVIEKAEEVLKKYGLTRYAMAKLIYAEEPHKYKTYRRLKKVRQNQRTVDRQIVKLKMFIRDFLGGGYRLWSAYGKPRKFFSPALVKLSEPRKPICPTGALYCLGAILPGDCPKRWRAECAMADVKKWEEVERTYGVLSVPRIKKPNRAALVLERMGLTI